MIRRLKDLCLRYNDIALLSRQIKDIREITDNLSEIGKKIELNINSKKTVFMKVMTSPTTIEGMGRTVRGKECTSLGSINSKTCGSDEDI